MVFHEIEAGPVDTVGYVVGDERSGDAVIIDVPISSSAELQRLVSAHGLTVGSILLTHGHFDHVGDVRALSDALGARVCIAGGDAAMLEHPSTGMFQLPYIIEGMTAHHLLTDGETIQAGGLRIEVLHVPGHTPGHVAFHLPDEQMLFCGDVLFHSSIGRTDLPGGDYDQLMNRITHRLLTLPPETVVYPGHGPHTTIGFETEHNPFIREYLDHY